jgi:hypothetical protein
VGAHSTALFDAAARMHWSSDPTTGPDLHDLIESTLEAAGSSPQGLGQRRVLDTHVPVYLFWLRDDSEKVFGIVAVVCRRTGDTDAEEQSFAFARALLRPALECLRRELLSRNAIASLNTAVNARDHDLELLLADGALDRTAIGNADELDAILSQAIERVGASMASLIVPDKSIALLRSKAPRWRRSIAG